MLMAVIAPWNKCSPLLIISTKRLGSTPLEFVAASQYGELR
jgi:hypothetical protein